MSLVIDHPNFLGCSVIMVSINTALQCHAVISTNPGICDPLMSVSVVADDTLYECGTLSRFAPPYQYLFKFKFVIVNDKIC